MQASCLAFAPWPPLCFTCCFPPDLCCIDSSKMFHEQRLACPAGPLLQGAGQREAAAARTLRTGNHAAVQCLQGVS